MKEMEYSNFKWLLAVYSEKEAVVKAFDLLDSEVKKIEEMMGKSLNRIESFTYEGRRYERPKDRLC